MADYDDDLDTGDGRVSIKFSPQVKKNLERIAASFDLTLSALVKMLVEHGLMLEGVLESGGEVIARAPNGTEFKLIKEQSRVVLRDNTGEFIWAPRLKAGR